MDARNSNRQREWKPGAHTSMSSAPSVRPPPPPVPSSGDTTWVVLSIRGLDQQPQLHQTTSSFSGDKTSMNSFLKFKKPSEATTLRDAVLSSDNGGEEWRSETIEKVSRAGTLDFCVPAPLSDDSREDFVVRLEAKIVEEASTTSTPLPRVVGTATFSRSLLLSAAEASSTPRQQVSAQLQGSGPLATCVARVARSSSSFRAFEAIAHAVADPDQMRIDQALALGGESPLLSREVCVEPRGTHDIVRGALQPVADAMLESAAAWVRRSDAARSDAALFEHDAEARSRGARRVRLGILGARGLRRRVRDKRTSGGNSSKSAAAQQSLKKTWSAAVGLAKRIRDGEAPRFGVDDGGDAAPPSCYAVAELRSTKRPFPEKLGRTNTEYATESPAWGANARADSSCPHSKPSTDFLIATSSDGKRPPIARLKSPAECGDPAGIAPQFEFYARRDETADGHGAAVVIKIYDERYTVTRGVEAVYLGEVIAYLPTPHSGVESGTIAQQPTWLALKKGVEDDGGGAEPAGPSEILVSLRVDSLDGDELPEKFDAAFADEASRRADRAAEDAAMLHSWLAFAGVKVDDSVAELALADEHDSKVDLLAGDYAAFCSEAATSNKKSADTHPLRLHEHTWLETHAKSLARNGDQLARFAEDARSASTVRSSAFKSSMLKAEIGVAATPTNLHVHIFGFSSDNSQGGGESVWTAATSGAPTAAGPLGAQRGGLLRLEAELVDLAASIKRKRSEFATLPHNAPGRKAAAAELGTASRAWEARAAMCGVRKTLCRAHALSIAVAAVRAAICRLGSTSPSTDSAAGVLTGWINHGFLVVFEALVSTAGNELAMLEDAAAAVQSLNGSTVVVEQSAEKTCAPPTQSPDGSFNVVIRVPPAIFRNLGESGDRAVSFRLVPVLFSQGLDVRQSIANRRAAFDIGRSTIDGSTPTKASSSSSVDETTLDDDDAALDDSDDDSSQQTPTNSAALESSATGLQRILNAEAMDAVASYAIALRGTDAAVAALKLAVDKERLAASEGKALEKHWLILVEAERAARALGGSLCVFCKSGKDRTAMIVTLANAMFYDADETSRLPVELAVNDDSVLRRANLLREYGVRLRIAEKNTGRKKFAFNVFQRKFLPPPLRPPISVIEDLVSSAINRDTS